jgi:hypothetical protein
MKFFFFFFENKNLFLLHSRINLDFDLWQWSFQGFFDKMIYTWLTMQLSSLLVVCKLCICLNWMSLKPCLDFSSENNC